MHRLIAQVTVVALICLPAIAGAETVYRWTDAAGVMHFGQHPPDKGTYTTLQTDTSGTGSNTANRSSASNYLRQSEAQDSAAGKAHEADVTAKAEHAENCAKAREHLASLTDSPPHRFMVTGTDGQPSRMTDEQFEEQLDAAKKDESRSCS